MDFTRLFVQVDCWKSFEKIYAKHLTENGTRKLNRQSNLSISEIMTILIAFQTSGYRTFNPTFALWRWNCKFEKYFPV
jgi:hypothetical protein